jgi:hypothetical protein
MLCSNVIRCGQMVAQRVISPPNALAHTRRLIRAATAYKPTCNQGFSCRT